LFGHGGIAAEIIGDRCIGLPPLNANLARDMIGRTDVARLLAGYRDRPPVRIDAVAGALVSLSDLVIDFPEITELDINPLLADADGVIALDARIIVRPPSEKRAPLAIRPYPVELTSSLDVDGVVIQLRPIRPQDGPRLLDMARRAEPDDLRLRFHGSVGLSDARAARLSQIDYDREMVFVADMPDDSVGGVVRLIFDPNFEEAECAIIVRSDLPRHHMGRTLMTEALGYARSRGARHVFGDVLAENKPILALAGQLGARLTINPLDARLTRVEFQLD
jgi:acetyltransferase